MSELNKPWVEDYSTQTKAFVSIMLKKGRISYNEIQKALYGPKSLWCPRSYISRRAARARRILLGQGWILVNIRRFGYEIVPTTGPQPVGEVYARVITLLQEADRPMLVKEIVGILAERDGIHVGENAIRMEVHRLRQKGWQIYTYGRHGYVIPKKADA